MEMLNKTEEIVRGGERERERRDTYNLKANNNSISQQRTADTMKRESEDIEGATPDQAPYPTLIQVRCGEGVTCYI